MADRPKFYSGSPYESRIGFCRAIRVENAIYISGTAPVGPDRKTVGAGDPAAQTRRCFAIIKEAVEKIMREHFGEDPGGGLEFD